MDYGQMIKLLIKLDICFKKRGHLNSNIIFYKSINFDSVAKNNKIV